MFVKPGFKFSKPLFYEMFKTRDPNYKIEKPVVGLFMDDVKNKRKTKLDEIEIKRITSFNWKTGYPIEPKEKVDAKLEIPRNYADPKENFLTNPYRDIETFITDLVYNKSNFIL